MAIFLVNGKPAEALPLTDRGLHYGDGLFETIAVVQGRPLHWDAHMARLHRGCTQLRIPVPDLSHLATEAGQLTSGQEAAVLKVIITRGSGGRGYAAPHAPEPTRVLGLYPPPSIPDTHYRDGVVVHRCATRLTCQPALAGVKHLNRLEQVLARSEWEDPQIAEGLMYDGADRLVEAVSSNIFLVRGGHLITPDLSTCGVAGTARTRILAQAKQWGIPTEIRALEPDEELRADEIFLSNSLIGIWPIRRYETWQAGVQPLTRRLMAALPAPFYTGVIA